MKNFKFLYLLLAVVGAVAFTSCTEEWYPGEPDTNAGVYFPNTSAIVVTPETTSVDIVVERTNTAEDLTVNVRSQAAENADDFLSVTSKSVTFAAGEQSSVLTVAVSNAANMQKGVKYQLNIKLDAEQASTYGVSEATFTFMLPEPWVDYVDESGKLIYGTYIDDFFPAFLEYEAGYAVPMQIQKHETDPNRFRVVEPFGTKFCKDMLGGVPAFMSITDGAYIEFDATNPADVKVVNNPVFTGVHVNFTDLGAMPISMIVSDAPGSVTFEDGVFRFAPNAVTMDAADAGSMAVNSTGLMAYVLPGGVVTDYKLSVNYTGMYVAADNSSAEAVLEFGAGADVEAIKYTVVEGDVTADYASVVTSIVDGSADPLIEITEAEQLTQEIALTRGSWTVVAVPYGADGAVENKAVAYTFWFNGVGEVPQVEVEVRFGSMYELTGEESEQFSSDYWAGIGIVANGDDVKSVKAFVSTLAAVENSGMSYDYILSNYGQDFSSVISELKANGAAIVGPFNLPLETVAIALVAVETIYGEVKTFTATCTTTNTTGIKFGEYQVSEGDYSTVVAIFGGYEAGQAYFVIDGMFEMEGSYDTAARTITTPGVEEYYTDGFDIIQNTPVFYTNSQTKTHTYGYWAATDSEECNKACDLTFAYGEDGAINALACYFQKRIYDVTSSSAVFDSYEYAFTPAATVVKYEAAAAAKAGALACAKSTTSNAQLANVTVKSGDRIWVPAM